MDTEQLRVIVENLGAYPHHVQFGGLPNEALVIEPHDGGWRVFYSERGRRSDEAWHPIESDAVDDLLVRLLTMDTLSIAARGYYGWSIWKDQQIR